MIALLYHAQGAGCIFQTYSLVLVTVQFLFVVVFNEGRAEACIIFIGLFQEG